MIFQSLKFTKQKPFDDVLIHGLIRAEDGRKMSKSLGNGIDPMDVIDSHGADSLRLFLTSNSATGQDLRFSTEKLDASWNFLNKLWNVSRFVMMNNEDFDSKQDLNTLDSADNFIINELNNTIKSVNSNMEKYEFAEVFKTLYNFIWNDFAAWYLEISKIDLSKEETIQRSNKQYLLNMILEDIIKLLHPFVPFITDEIYSSLNTKNILCSSGKIF